MPAHARVTYVNLDDTGLEIEVVWEPTNIGERIAAEADSLQAVAVRMAAEDVVAGHLDHLGQSGYIIGEPRPGEMPPEP